MEGKRVLLETDRVVIAEFDEGMAESVHLNSLYSDNRRFVPDEVAGSILSAGMSGREGDR